jgi:hypothetical protein
MNSNQKVTFQEALEIIESLPISQQDNLINIINNRLKEYRRDSLADNIKEARDDFNSKKVQKGTVDELMRNLSE